MHFIVVYLITLTLQLNANVFWCRITSVKMQFSILNVSTVSAVCGRDGPSQQDHCVL